MYKGSSRLLGCICEIFYVEKTPVSHKTRQIVPEIAAVTLSVEDASITRYIFWTHSTAR